MSTARNFVFQLFSVVRNRSYSYNKYSMYCSLGQLFVFSCLCGPPLWSQQIRLCEASLPIRRPWNDTMQNKGVGSVAIDWRMENGEWRMGTTVRYRVTS